MRYLNMVDRFVSLPASPLAAGGAAHIRYRDAGAGAAVVILHGGWGYDIYPFDRQIESLVSRHRVVVPDRTGYGQSGALDIQRPDFHQRAAEETLALLDALALERPVVWGHSDGAVIALRLGLMAPARVGSIIGEATHYLRGKPASRGFFETMRDAPDRLGDRVAATLQRDHGDRWRALIRTNGSAWLQIADQAATAAADLYDGRLPELTVPTLLIHGANDPRTEPGELEALCRAIRGVRCERLADGGHSPHSDRATADAVTRIVEAWIA
jgi:pimeloyl-ACP methyl ester carboxylesterase